MVTVENLRALVIEHRVSILIGLAAVVVVMAIGWLGWRRGTDKQSRKLQEAYSQTSQAGAAPQQASVVPGKPVVTPAAIKGPHVPDLPPVNSALPQMYLNLLEVVPGEHVLLIGEGMKAGATQRLAYRMTKMPQRDVWSVSDPAGKQQLFETWGDLCTYIGKCTQTWPVVGMRFPDGRTLSVQRSKRPRDIDGAGDDPWLGGTYYDTAYVNQPPGVFNR